MGRLFFFSGVFLLFSCDLANQKWGKIKDSLSLSQFGKKSETQNPALTRAHSELFQEVYQVVFMVENRDPDFLSSWVDTLNQGASLEGIYNGLTHSSEYRKLEIDRSRRKKKTLEVFADELLEVGRKRKTPSRFVHTDTLPLERLEKPQPGMVEKSVEYSSLEAQRQGHQQDVEDLKKLFQDASIFTLKRVIGDELLALIEEKKGDRRELNAWYLDFVKRTNSYSVDFGLDLRNQSDFHRKWVEQASLDRLRWEVLNRIHRLLNHFEK